MQAYPGFPAGQVPGKGMAALGGRSLGGAAVLGLTPLHPAEALGATSLILTPRLG